MYSLSSKSLHLTRKLIEAKKASILSFRARRSLPKTGLKSQSGILSSFASGQSASIAFLS